MIDKQLPPGYDRSLEPIARRKLRYSAQSTSDALSGYSYVVGLLNGEHAGGAIRIAAPNRCDHSTTICEGKTETGSYCADEWQYDYSLLWSRTTGGRVLITRLGTERCRNQNKRHPARIFNDEADRDS